MAIKASQRLAYRLFGPIATRLSQDNPRLRTSLLQAHIFLRPEMYLASMFAILTLAVTVVSIPVLAIFILDMLGVFNLPDAAGPLMLMAPIGTGVILYLMAFLGPQARGQTRARKIDAKLPYALNYIATMASAGVTPGATFGSLAKQEIYGEVADEAALIHRDLTVLGVDLVSAITAALDRTPSTRFQDLLQGAVTVLTSGGDLQTYFMTKADQYILDNRAEQKSFLETLGVLAEAFVTVVVAAPLFLLVLLSVMTTFGTDANQLLTIGYIIVLVIMPLAFAGFAVTITTITPEA